jgi:hypothetical protein
MWGNLENKKEHRAGGGAEIRTSSKASPPPLPPKRAYKTLQRGLNSSSTSSRNTPGTSSVATSAGSSSSTERKNDEVPLPALVGMQLGECEVANFQAKQLLAALGKYSVALRELALSRAQIANAMHLASHALDVFGAGTHLGVKAFQGASADAVSGVEAQITAGLIEKVLEPLSRLVSSLTAACDLRAEFERALKRVEHYKMKISSLTIHRLVEREHREEANANIASRERLLRNNMKFAHASHALYSLCKHVGAITFQCLSEYRTVLDATFRHIVHFQEARAGSEHLSLGLLLQVMRTCDGSARCSFPEDDDVVIACDRPYDQAPLEEFIMLRGSNSNIQLIEGWLTTFEQRDCDKKKHQPQHQQIRCVGKRKFCRIVGPRLLVYSTAEEAWGTSVKQSSCTEYHILQSIDGEAQSAAVLVLLSKEGSSQMHTGSFIMHFAAVDAVSAIQWRQAFDRAASWDGAAEMRHQISSMTRASRHRVRALYGLREEISPPKADKILRLNPSAFSDEWKPCEENYTPLSEATTPFSARDLRRSTSLPNVIRTSPRLNYYYYEEDSCVPPESPAFTAPQPPKNNSNISTSSSSSS